MDEGFPPAPRNTGVTDSIETRPAPSVLASALATATATATVAEGPVPFWEAVWQDVVAHVPPKHRPRSRWGWAWRALKVAVRSSGFHVTLGYRLSHSLHAHGGVLGRAAAAVPYWWIRHVYGCDLAPSARLHGGLILPHPQGIVVGRHVVVGVRSWIFQNVTLGGAPGQRGQPRVGRDARLYTGCVLAGPIVVGDQVIVGANAVVLGDVPSCSLVRSPRAEVVPRRLEPGDAP